MQRCPIVSGSGRWSWRWFEDSFSLAEDDFAKIGEFIGGAVDVAVAVQKESVQSMVTWSYYVILTHDGWPRRIKSHRNTEVSCWFPGPPGFRKKTTPRRRAVRSWWTSSEC